MGFLYGHCRLSKHLARVGLEEEEEYRICKKDEETPEHLG